MEIKLSRPPVGIHIDDDQLRIIVQCQSHLLLCKEIMCEGKVIKHLMLSNIEITDQSTRSYCRQHRKDQQICVFVFCSKLIDRPNSLAQMSF